VRLDPRTQLDPGNDQRRALAGEGQDPIEGQQRLAGRLAVLEIAADAAARVMEGRDQPPIGLGKALEIGLLERLPRFPHGQRRPHEGRGDRARRVDGAMGRRPRSRIVPLDRRGRRTDRDAGGQGG
jgi:hypothetical protein